MLADGWRLSVQSMVVLLVVIPGSWSSPVVTWIWLVGGWLPLAAGQLAVAVGKSQSAGET